jgi:6-phosphofructokinase 1
LGIDRGHVLLGIHDGFEGFVDGAIEEMNWMSVNGWSIMGGSNLGQAGVSQRERTCMASPEI